MSLTTDPAVLDHHLATFWERVKDDQETITDGDADRTTGSGYMSPAFRPTVELRGNTDASDETLLRRLSQIIDADPECPDGLVDSFGNERDPFDWISQAVGLVRPWCRNPLDRGEQAAKLESPIFGRRANGNAKRSLLVKALLFILGTSGAKDGDAVGLGDRQLGTALGIDHGAAWHLKGDLKELGWMEVVAPHRFIGEGHTQNLVETLGVVWKAIPWRVLRLLGQVSSFCAALYERRRADGLPEDDLEADGQYEGIMKRYKQRNEERCRTSGEGDDREGVGCFEPRRRALAA